MNSFRIKLLFTVLILLCLCTSQSLISETTQGIWEKDTVSGDLIYLPLQIRFPEKFRLLVYNNKTICDDIGQDISVGYNSNDFPLLFTFFIYLKSYYPHKDMKSHFESLVGDIYNKWQNSELVAANWMKFPFDNITVDGFSAFVQYESGPTPGEWGGMIWLLPYGDYYIMMRVSFAGFDQEIIREAIWNITGDFLISLKLPAPD